VKLDFAFICTSPETFLYTFSYTALNLIGIA
jgi:hypothetical protein